MASLSVLSAKQEVPAIAGLWLIDPCHFHTLNVTIVFGYLRNPLPVKTAQIKKKQGYTDASCLAKETGSDDILDFTVAFSKSRNPFL